MGTPGTSGALKLQKSMIDWWRHISLELENYSGIVDVVRKHISLLLAHQTTLKNIVKTNIQETELSRIEPNIHLKLRYCIQKEILCEEIMIQNYLNDLQKNFVAVVVSIDNILNLIKSCDLNTEEIVKGSETSLPPAEKLQALHRFKKLFSDGHNMRKDCLDLVRLTEEDEKISSLWNISEVLSQKQDLDVILSVE